MENIIEVKHLSFSVGSTEIIKDINFNIKKGSITTILGNTASGKTTIIKLLTGILKGSGEINVADKEINKMQINDLKEIGIVFNNNDFNFVTDTVEGNLIFPLENLRYSNEEIEKSLNDIVRLFKLETLLDKKISELTREEKFIVALASALILRPSILLLDDILSKIGLINRKKIVSLLKTLNNKYSLTIINFTNDINEILFGKEVIVLSMGKVVIMGDILEIISEETLLKKYHFELPFIIDLSNKLQYYNVVDKMYFDVDKLVNAIWK